MKRKLISLVPWMAMTTAAYGQARSADVVYTYFDDTPIHGYRVGEECFVPVDDVAKWGWKVEGSGESLRISVDGTDFNFSTRTISGKSCLPIRAAISKLGGTADWIVNTDTLQILGTLTSVSVDSGKIKVSSPLQFKTKAFVLTDPSRVVLDFVGARLGAKTTQVLEGGVRLTQYKPNVVRLVLQTTGLVDLSRLATEPTKNTTIELTVTNPPEEKVLPTEETPTHPRNTTVSKIEPGVIDGSATAPTVGPLPLVLERENEKSALLTMKLSGISLIQPLYEKPSPSVLQITLPGVFQELPADFKLDTESISSVTSIKTLKGTVVTLNLARPLGAEVYSEGKNVLIQLFKPNVGDGKLLGKLIVVDAGHGGTDGGANSGGVHEKDLNLALATLMSQRLTEEGATVIMTRKTDVFIPLMTRSDIANNSHADFFISCHCNDTGGSGNMSGGITFHHKGNLISRVMAECIQQQIGAVSGIPSIGVWSDGKIYPQSGFSVLRNIKMVGVLIEFGFLNNERDRKRLSTAQFQDAVTRAAVRGLKVYLGDAKTK